MDWDDERAETPFDAWKDDQASAIRPDFVIAPNHDSTETLRDAEDWASRAALGSNFGDSIDGARQAESNIESDKESFKNNVIGRGMAGRLASMRSGLKGSLSIKGGFTKRLAPTVMIFTMIFGGGGIMAGTQAAMPFSLIAQVQGNFDSINVSNRIRSKYILRMQMGMRDDDMVKNCIKPHYLKEDEFKISKRQAKSLAQNHIEVDEDVNGKTIMRYTSLTGEVSEIHASEFEQRYNNDAEFRRSYDGGSKTWRGSVAAWYDKVSEKFFKFIGVKRGTWAKYKRGVSTEEDFKGAISEGAGGKMEGDIDTTTHEGSGVPDVDENQQAIAADTRGESSNVKKSFNADDIEIDPVTNTADTSKMSAKLKDVVDGRLGKVSGAASMVANMGCSVFDAMTAVNLIVIAYQTTQILKVTMPILEGIQKAQAGDGENAPIHEIAKALITTSIMQYGSTLDVSGGKDVTEVAMKMNSKTTGSAMSSEAISAMYGNRKVNLKDPSVRSYNPLNSISETSQNLTGGTSFKDCSVARLSAAATGAVGDGVSIVLCIFSFGVGCALNFLADAVLPMVASISMAAVVNIVVGIAVPYFASATLRKIATDVCGEDLGNALMSGVNMLFGGNHRTAGGAVADKEGFKKYIVAQMEVNQEIAREERESLSPFDITSQNTFLGSLYKDMVPVFAQSGKVMSSIGNVGNVLASSVKTLMPAANALTAANMVQSSVEQTSENCTYLDSIGAVGDAFCNPIVVTDTTSLKVDPAEVTDRLVNAGQIEIDSNEEVKIKKDSDLAKWIVYCGQRVSPFGMPDQNIISDFAKGETGSTIANATLGAIPVLGDTIDLLTQASNLNNMGYITGESCVTNNAHDGLVSMGTPDWTSAQSYQRFVEDQRLMENMGVTEKSAVTAFLDDYYQEHPLDNSFEGILARFSGLTKENVIATLDFMGYESWLAEYEPAEYGPYPMMEEEDEEIRIEEENYGFESTLALIRNISIEDRRQKNFAA